MTAPQIHKQRNKHELGERPSPQLTDLHAHQRPGQETCDNLFFIFPMALTKL